MVKKLTVLGIVAIMLLSVFGFAACTENLNEYKVIGKGLIDAFAATKTQADYSADGWEAICKEVTDCKTEVDKATSKTGVDTAVTIAKNEINAVLTKEQEMSDFVLTISVDKTTLQRNEDFRVYATLKNQSGERQEIGFNYGFIAHIPGYSDFFDTDNPSEIPDPRTLFLDNNEVLSNLCYWGEVDPEGILITNRLESGTHEMQFHFLFSFSGQSIRIWSNKMILTVQ